MAEDGIRLLVSILLLITCINYKYKTSIVNATKNFTISKRLELVIVVINIRCFAIFFRSSISRVWLFISEINNVLEFPVSDIYKILYYN